MDKCANAPSQNVILVGGSWFLRVTSKSRSILILRVRVTCPYVRTSVSSDLGTECGSELVQKFTNLMDKKLKFPPNYRDYPISGRLPQLVLFPDLLVKIVAAAPPPGYPPFPFWEMSMASVGCDVKSRKLRLRKLSRNFANNATG